MKAVRIHEYGTTEALRYEDAPQPVAGPGEVLVRVRAASVNPVDAKTRRGAGIAGRLHDPFPLILGWDLAGDVVDRGPGVDELEVGSAVYGMARFPDVGAAYAEFAAVPARDLAPLPAGIDYVAAAAVPLAALTAYQVLFEAANLQAGQRVLIHAAAGGVGHLAVQLARSKGANVVGTASAHNHDLLRELGVDVVIDYQATPFEQQVQGVDVVLDPLGSETALRSLAVLRPGGTLVSIVGGITDAVAAAAAAAGVAATNVLVRVEPAHLAAISALLQAGQLRSVVETVLPLREAAQAHALIESGRTRGKIVLAVS